MRVSHGHREAPGAATGQGSVRFPNWSPDGAWIMFTEYRDVSPTQVVYAIRPDGSERIQLSGPEDEIGVGWLLVP